MIEYEMGTSVSACMDHRQTAKEIHIMDFITFLPALLQGMDLFCGLSSLLYCILSALLVLRGFVLKDPVSSMQINLAGISGLIACLLYCILLGISGIGLNLWSTLNLLADLTFLLFFLSRRKPRLAVYALYIQAFVYLMFVLRLIVVSLDLSLLFSFVIFQLIPAALLTGVAILVIIQTEREHRDPTADDAFSLQALSEEPAEQEPASDCPPCWHEDAQADHSSPPSSEHEEHSPSSPDDMSQ